MKQHANLLITFVVVFLLSVGWFSGCDPTPSTWSCYVIAHYTPSGVVVYKASTYYTSPFTGAVHFQRYGEEGEIAITGSYAVRYVEANSLDYFNDKSDKAKERLRSEIK